MSDLDLVVRVMTPEDRPYVAQCWLQEYAEAKEIRGYLRAIYQGSRRAFFDAYSPTVNAILDRSTVLVASLRGVPSSVVGYAVLEEATEPEKPGILHYTYTKARWRRLGVQKFLVGSLRDTAITYSHTPNKPVVLPPSWEYRANHRWPAAERKESP